VFIVYYEMKIRNTDKSHPAILLLIGLALIGPRAAAHDLWLAREGESFALYRGHLHSAHEGEAMMPYEPAIVQRVACFAADGAPLPFQPEARYPLRLPGDCAAGCVLTSSGYWTKTPYGTENKPRAQASQAIRSWQSLESVKFIARWCPRFAAPLTADLEIVPLADPAACREDDKLELLVVLDGAPVADAIVTYAGKPRGKTGEDGRMNIRLREPGLQLIQASLTLPDTSGIADEIVRTATLNFELEAKR